MGQSEAGRTGTAPVLSSGVRLGAYLRRLREGYGYTLRKVEERTAALGEPIDNSQLSRFEKGKAIPSFEKLRALARIFNVSVQNFSDMLDLEAYEAFRPGDRRYDDLLREGADLFASGEHGRAFVTFERAVEVASEEGGPEAAERIAEARWRVATALKALGKLAMTEHELRTILRDRPRPRARTRMRALMQLSFVYREMGDLDLAAVMARECLGLAREEEDAATQAAVLNTLGNIRHDDEDPAGALGYHRDALDLLESLGAPEEHRIGVLINIGGCLTALGRAREGIGVLAEARVRASARGFRRQAALSLTRLAEARLQEADREAARRDLDASDRLAGREDDPLHDILFLNAYRRWEMARDEGHPTREKIAFGRLRHLRARLERLFPEVEAFDRHVESTRRTHAAHA